MRRSRRALPTRVRWWWRWCNYVENSGADANISFAELIVCASHFSEWISESILQLHWILVEHSTQPVLVEYVLCAFKIAPMKIKQIYWLTCRRFIWPWTLMPFMLSWLNFHVKLVSRELFLVVAKSIQYRQSRSRRWRQSNKLMQLL